MGTWVELLVEKDFVLRVPQPIHIRSSMHKNTFHCGALDNITSIYLSGNPGNSAPVDNALKERKK